MYNTCCLPEHKGNPLIEALPPIKDDKTLAKSLRTSELVTPDERNLPKHIREKILFRIFRFVEPTTSYLRVFRAIESAMLESYIPKNPLLSSAQHWLHYLNHEEMTNYPSTGRFTGRPISITLLGPSGAGKSYMLEKILALYPQKITHRGYAGKPLEILQIPWIKIDFPVNGTLSGLIDSIHEQLDRLTGSSEASRSYRGKESLAIAANNLERKLRWNFLGLLVIDEVQGINSGNANQQRYFLQFILELMNRSSIPIVFSGNPELVKPLLQTMRISRRAENGGVFVMDQLSRGEWKLFVEHLWSYQWTNPPTAMTKILSDTLFHLCTGLPEFAARIYKKAQELAIATGDENISPALLTEAYYHACAFTKGALDGRRKYFKTKIEPAVPDAVMLENWDSQLNDEIPQIIKSKNEVSIKRLVNSRKSIPDVNRVQHEEFLEKLTILKDAHFNRCPPAVMPDLIRNSGLCGNPIELLKGSKTLLSESIFAKFTNGYDLGK
jgi:hypothetical protein